MPEQRYKVMEAHDNYYIQDTTKPVIFEGKQIGHESVCVCYEEEKAKFVCGALNEMEAKNENKN